MYQNEKLLEFKQFFVINSKIEKERVMGFEPTNVSLGS